MSDFSWMSSPTPPTRRSVTAATRDDEIRRRATTLAGLGFSQSQAEARLRAKIEWEYELVGKPALAKRVAALVADAYKRAPAPTAKKAKRR